MASALEINERIRRKALQDAPTSQGEDVGVLLEKMPNCPLGERRHGDIVDDVLPRKKSQPKDRARRKPAEKPAGRKKRHKEFGISKESYEELLRDWEEHRASRDDLSLSHDAYWIEGRSKALEKQRGKRGGIGYWAALGLAERLRKGSAQGSVRMKAGSEERINQTDIVSGSEEDAI